MNGGVIVSSIFLATSAVLLYVAVGFLTRIQGSANTTTDYRYHYATIAKWTMPLVTILFATAMALLYYFNYFHYSFYVIPAVLAFSMSFAALAISFVKFA
jgi:hypothetical protein